MPGVYRKQFARARRRPPRRLFVAGVAGAALAAGTASFVSSAPGGISVAATDATGGTPAYTYQWQRNANGGSYSNLSGATSLTLTDSTASAGTLYGYKLVYTDALSATVTSNVQTAQVYSGGALTGGILSPFSSAVIRGVA